jgi:hypothetical protein
MPHFVEGLSHVKEYSCTIMFCFHAGGDLVDSAVELVDGGVLGAESKLVVWDDVEFVR